jgi:hypothetical protein
MLDMPDAPFRPRHRFLRFSLRTLFVAATLAAVAAYVGGPIVRGWLRPKPISPYLNPILGIGQDALPYTTSANMVRQVEWEGNPPAVDVPAAQDDSPD